VGYFVFGWISFFSPGVLRDDLFCSVIGRPYGLRDCPLYRLPEWEPAWCLPVLLQPGTVYAHRGLLGCSHFLRGPGLRLPPQGRLKKNFPTIFFIWFLVVAVVASTVGLFLLSQGHPATVSFACFIG